MTTGASAPTLSRRPRPATSHVTRSSTLMAIVILGGIVTSTALNAFLVPFL
jgi:multidrug efflux pump subunit AcrB